MRDSRFRKQRFNANGLAERIAILLVVAVVAGISIGLLMPKVNPTVGEMTGEYVATGSAAETLQSLTIDDQPSRAGYDRDSFGFRQTDDDGNGCDVREDVLARDLTDVRYIAGSGFSSDSGSGSGAGCKVKSGVLSDPYTGTTIRFTRGVKTSSAVQIDHVVALENAWQSGANQWDRTKRYRFGNDMYNLLAVDGPANQEKGSASAAYWLPTNGAYRCDVRGPADRRESQVRAETRHDEGKRERAMLSVLRGAGARRRPCRKVQPAAARRAGQTAQECLNRPGNRCRQGRRSQVRCRSPT